MAETDKASASDAAVVVFIPGPWADHTEAIRAIAEANEGKVLAAGGIMMDVAGRRHAAFWTEDADPALAESMQKLSGNALDEQTIAAIQNQKSRVVLAMEPTWEGLAERVAFFTAAVRKAGGYAVAVRRPGLAHPWERWETLLGDGELWSLYRALIVHVTWEDELTCFGMAQFGLPDASVPANLDDAAWTLAQLNVYELVEQPDLRDGHTFRKDAESPRLRLHHAPDDRYPPEHPCHNAHGVWHLREG